MNGEMLMEKLLNCEETRRRIPLELQATLPLPCAGEGHTVVCWYYRLDSRGGMRIYSPALRVQWDADELSIVHMQTLPMEELGSAMDLLDKAQREREDAYLNGPLTEYLTKGHADNLESAWLDAAPSSLRPWLNKALEEMRNA